MKDKISAKEIIAGARVKIPHYKLRMVKDRARSYAVSRITSPSDLAKIAMMELGHLPHEEVIAIGLNARNEPLGVVKVSQGGISGSAIMASETLRPLIMMGASAFVLAHNHPSGSTVPSQEDRHLTRKMKEGAECVGITMLDHLIVVRSGAWASAMHD
jgi:DNA repair protein RadC